MATADNRPQSTMTRDRNRVTLHPIATSPSMSASTFIAQAKCDEINSQVPLRTHIQKWSSLTETEEPTPSPNEKMMANADTPSYRLKSTPMYYDEYDQDGVPEDAVIDLVGIPFEAQHLEQTRSTPNLLQNSDTSPVTITTPLTSPISVHELKVMTKPNLGHLSSHSVNLDSIEDEYKEKPAWDFYSYTDGSMTPQVNRTRRSTINPRGHHPSISRGVSDSELIHGMVDSADVNLEPDGNFDDTGSEEDDEIEEDTNSRDLEKQSARVTYTFSVYHTIAILISILCLII